MAEKIKPRSSLRGTFRLFTYMLPFGFAIAAAGLFGYAAKEQKELIDFAKRKIEVNKVYDNEDRRERKTNDNGAVYFESHDTRDRIRFVDQGKSMVVSKTQPLCTLWLYDCAALIAIDKNQQGIYHVHNSATSRDNIKDWLNTNFSETNNLDIYVLEGSEDPAEQKEFKLKYMMNRFTDYSSVRKIYEVLKEMNLEDRTKFIETNSEIVGERPGIEFSSDFNAIFVNRNVGSTIVLADGKLYRDLVDYTRLAMEIDFLEGKLGDTQLMFVPPGTKVSSMKR